MTTLPDLQTNKNKKIRELAKKLYSYLGQYFDKEGEEYWTINPHRPVWVSDLIDQLSSVEGFGIIFFNDRMRDRLIADALNIMIDENMPDESLNFPDIKVDESMWNCLKWAISNPYRVEYYLPKAEGNIADYSEVLQVFQEAISLETFDIYNIIFNYLTNLIEVGGPEE